MTKKLCKCGCGRPVNKEKNTYIFGHHNNDISDVTREKIRLWHTGRKFSEEAKHHMSLGHKGQNLGTHRSEETKRKISKSNKGKIRTQETIEKWRIKVKGRKQTKEEIEKRAKKLIGQKRSAEARKRMSIAASGINNSQYGKRKSKGECEYIRERSIKLNTGQFFPNWTGIKRPLFSKEHIEHIRQKRLIQKHCYTTSIELRVRKFLKELNIRYIPHKCILGKYQCDIFIPQYNLVIECDGNYWHKYPNGTERDKIRTREMTEKGYKVLRLWESDIRQMSTEIFKEKLGVINGGMV